MPRASCLIASCWAGAMSRRAEILERAAEVFDEVGYRGASVREVARRVGLLKGSLYHHVRSKEELLAEVLLRGIEFLHGGLPGAGDARLSPGEKVRAAIRFHMEWIAAEPHVTGVFLREARTLPPRLRRRVMAEVKGFEGRWVALVREGIRKGAFRPDLDPKLTVYAILGLINSVHRWHRPGGRLAMTAVAEAFADLVLDGLRCRPSRG
jgi:TetR/AcrR family transcriptional regulator, cholesterol catabolism regulator